MQRAEAYFHVALFTLVMATIVYITAFGTHWPALPAPL